MPRTYRVGVVGCGVGPGLPAALLTGPKDAPPPYPVRRREAQVRPGRGRHPAQPYGQAVAARNGLLRTRSSAGAETNGRAGTGHCTRTAARSPLAVRRCCEKAGGEYGVTVRLSPVFAHGALGQGFFR